MINSATIAAIATPVGRGGVGIIRLSGSKAYDIACQLTGKSSFQPRLATYCRFYAAVAGNSTLEAEAVSENIIDEGLVLYFKAPHSFTGEDVIELQGHGGVILQNLLLARVFALGATQAQPGEFSYRAFENNKLDLVQAEAIADAIDATSAAAANSAIRSLTGAFSEQINQVLDALIELRLYVEAAIDFPEEDDVDFLSDGHIETKLYGIQQALASIQGAAKQGQLLRDGVHVVLVGRPNAGKSSLLNALAGQERAIVTHVAGTTRDTLQETLVLNGLTLRLTDTAGLRDTDDEIELMGIARARAAIEQADLLMLVYDLSQQDAPMTLAKQLIGSDIEDNLNVDSSKLLFIGNKRDLIEDAHTTLLADKTQIATYDNVNVSCETLQGLPVLIDSLCDKVGFHPPENSLIARTRHLDALRRTQQHLADAYVQLVEFQAGELVAESLRNAQLSLGEITGEFNADDLLGKIFGSFCIGK